MPIRLHVHDEVLTVEWRGAPDDRELESFFDDLARVTSRLSRYALLYDARLASAPSTSQRHLLSDLSRMLGPSLRERCVGAAFVIDSLLVRAALVAILWLAPMAIPHETTSSIDDARRWCKKRLGQARR